MMVKIIQVLQSSSSIPDIIPKDKIHLEMSGRDEKLPFGPIVDPRPGPTFEIEVAAPEIAVKKSRPDKDNKAEIKKNIIKYI